MFSGLASEMRMAWKSLMVRARSKKREFLFKVSSREDDENWLDRTIRQQLHVQAEALELPHEDVERLRQPGLGRDLALHEGLVDLRAPEHVVGLRGQKFLQRVRRPVRLEGPALHLSEPLAAELGLAPERLLGNQRVRADGAGVDLVVHEVGQLHEVDVAD